MTLDDLRVFVATCEAGNLSAVARRIGTTQPAVSQHVRRLERELGITLFERGRRGVTPTSAGRILLSAATDALNALDAGRGELELLRTGDTGTLRVSTGGATLRHFMARPLGEFRARHPGITFEYVSASSTVQCFEALRANRADLAFATVDAGHGLDERPVIRSPWALIVSADHPLADPMSTDHPSPRPEDLRGCHLVGMPPETASRAQLEEHLVAHGVRPRFPATVNDWDTAIRLTELGVGQAVVPTVWVHDLDERPLLRALPLPWVPPVTFGWAARRWDALPSHAHAFAELVAEELARLAVPAHAEMVG